MPDRRQVPALSDGPPRALLVAAVGVAVAAAVAVLVIAVTTSRQPQERPLVVPAVPVPQADAPECATLMGALPQRLGDYQRATPADPVPPGTAAWRSGSDDEPILLRCGVGQPTDFVVGAQINVVNTVQWFRVPEQSTGRSTWFVVDRPVYVALTLPQGTGATPIQEMSDVVAAKLPAVPIRPGPPR
ncbi:DUF3515 domain-containing protein [Mycobacterium sp.]|uniref:DUF3515 domain-containing protein n=1 Tax=Mycobacterium sp. TaxID=1785 RepID=UPI002F13C557